MKNFAIGFVVALMALGSTPHKVVVTRVVPAPVRHPFPNPAKLYAVRCDTISGALGATDAPAAPWTCQYHGVQLVPHGCKSWFEDGGEKSFVCPVSMPFEVR